MLSNRGRKSVYRRFTSILIVILFFTGSIEFYHTQNIKSNDDLCYGFIVPLVENEEDIIESQMNCIIKNMVNDLLREKIPVFWTSEEFNSVVKRIDNNQDIEMFFEKGTFIIPLTGNIDVDKKVIVIVTNYNESSEIEEFTEKIPIYYLLEEPSINAFELVELKILNSVNPDSWGLNYYIIKASKCGFLNFDFVDEPKLQHRLNNTTYNVVIWPGADPYPPVPPVQAFFKIIYRDLKYKISKTVRNFVSNGGGFIGSCYGAYVASSGILPFPVYFKVLAYNPKLPSFGIFCISDTLTRIVTKYLVLVTSRIVDNDHPIAYGLEEEVFDLHYGGPRFVQIERNSKVIARFKNSTKFYDGTPSTFMENTPSWVVSKFGKGRVVLFSTHPEMVDEDDHIPPANYKEGIGNGKKIISNSFFYSTCKDAANIRSSQPRKLSFIVETLKESSVKYKSCIKTGIFDSLKSNINEKICAFLNLISNGYKMIDLISLIAEKFNVNLTEKRGYLSPALSKYHLIYNYELFIDYFNKTLRTLDTIEDIYPLLQNDTEFVYQVNKLKNDMSERLNKIENISIKGEKLDNELINNLEDYYNYTTRSTFIETIISSLSFNLYDHFQGGFYNIPQCYFDSLKLLRTSWYNYKASIY